MNLLRGLPALLVTLAVALGAGCDTQNLQDEFAEQASLPPRGYTETDADGRVLSTDEDDWRTSPVYRGVIRLDPAYPNPPADEFVTIPVTITQFNAVRGGLVLRVYNQARQLIALDDITDTGTPGLHVFSFGSGLLQPGLHRLFVFDAAGEIVSYGDVLIG